MPILMEKSTRPTSPMNTLKRQTATGGSRAKVICLGTLCLAVGIANCLAINTYNYRGVCPVPNGGKRILDACFRATAGSKKVNAITKTDRFTFTTSECGQ